MTPAVGAACGFMPTATPGRTPAATSAAAALEQQGLDPVTAQQQVGAKAPGLSLDQFFCSYEGEDNASFKELHQKTLERKRAKVQHHLEDKNKPLLLEAGTHSTDEFGTSGQTPSSLNMTKHVPKNTLYYDSSQQKELALTAAEQATIVQGPPKVINHSATRSLHDSTAAVAGTPAAAELPPAAAAAAAEQRQQNKAAAAAVAPGTQGYGYMKTPQIVPGVDASPLMTWGDIASTPLRIDASDDIADGLEALGDPDSGPVSKQFTMPQVRSRELAAQQMLAGRSAAAGRRRQGSSTPMLDAFRRGKTAGTPAVRSGPAGSTPVRGGVQLSAAGLKLAQQLSGGSSSGRPGTGLTGLRSSSSKGVGGTDMQLRASYKAAATPSRPGPWDATPGRSGAAAGTNSRQQQSQRPKSGKISVQSSSRAAVGSQTSKQAAGANITDDLLQLG